MLRSLQSAWILIWLDRTVPLLCSLSLQLWKRHLAIVPTFTHQTQQRIISRSSLCSTCTDLLLLASHQAKKSLVEPNVVVEQGAVAAASTRIGDCVRQEQESREAFMWRLCSVRPSENQLLSPNERGHAMRLRMMGDI